MTFSVEPTRSAFSGPTVMVSRWAQTGSLAVSPEVARGFVTGGRSSATTNENVIEKRKVPRTCFIFHLNCRFMERMFKLLLESSVSAVRKHLSWLTLSVSDDGTHHMG